MQEVYRRRITVKAGDPVDLTNRPCGYGKLLRASMIPVNVCNVTAVLKTQ